MSLADDFIAAVEQATGRQGRRSGRHTRLICPCHDDQHPSLDVAEADDGSPLVQCRACQAGLPDVCARIGREISDFLPRQHSEWTPHGPAVATYDYTDAKGRLLFQAVRAANKRFAQRRPDPSAQHGWRWNLQGVELVPYRLPKVLEAASHGETVYVVEGEKDVHAIEAAGGTATCNPMGAGKWRDQYSLHLAGASEIVIVADDDPPGISHAEAVAASITTVLNGHQPRITLVKARTGKDAHDHLAAGHHLHDFEPLHQRRQPLAVSLDDFLAIDFQAPDSFLGTNDDCLLPAGGLAIVAGMPAVGKTTLIIDLAFHLASGVDWLAIPVPKPLRIMIIENEGPQHRFQLKLRQKKLSWPHPIQGELQIQTWRWGDFTFRDATNYFRDHLDEHDIDIVIGDPLDTLGPQGVGGPDETRDFVALLTPLGLTANRAFVFLHHFRKELAIHELNQVSGSWGGRLDTLLTLKAGDKDEESRLAFPKVRWGTQHPERKPLILGKLAPQLAFEILAEQSDTPPVDANAQTEMLSRITSALHRKGGGPVERPILALMCETATTNRTFNRALADGYNKGLLAKDQAGKKTLYSLTETAWDAIA